MTSSDGSIQEPSFYATPSELLARMKLAGYSIPVQSIKLSQESQELPSALESESITES
jgi:hypothetical protein